MRKAKYTAVVTFSHKGMFIPALCREMSFNTVAGAKRAFTNLLAKMEDTLHYNYGSGATIEITARCYGAGVDLINYVYYTH